VCYIPAAVAAAGELIITPPFITPLYITVIDNSSIMTGVTAVIAGIRIVTAVSRCLKNKYPQNEIKIPEPVAKNYVIFDLISRKSGKKYAYTLSNRIIAFYWEFIFIDSPRLRLNAYLKLLFPKPVVFMDIYNRQSKIFYCLYPFHSAGVLLSSVLFLPVLYGKKNF
jgi:hypothetical protein